MLTLSFAIFALTYYLLAGLGTNLGYHRVLSHRSLKLSKWLERALVTVGLPAGTPIQWAGNHRYHHAYTDTELDPHSPVHRGFWYAHVGWYIRSENVILCVLYSLAGPLRMLIDAWMRPRTNQEYNDLAKDVAADRWYRWISKPWAYGIGMYFHAAIPAILAWRYWGTAGVGGFWLALVALYNMGDAIDSVSHLYGDRLAGQRDASRNSQLMGILILGEGWHANHHLLPWSAKHGWGRRQFDWTWQVIRMLRALGLAKEVRVPSAKDLHEKGIVEVMTMQMTELYEKAPYNPEDPNPWLALYLDMSLPLSDEVKAALLSNSGSKSRQFLLPLIRPCAKLSMIAFQVLKIFIPNRFTSSKLLHRLIHWGLRNFVRPDANYLILRHFHIGSEILQFVASNVPGVEIPLNPLRPRNLAALVDDVFLKHDLNIYNFLIRINREMKARGIRLTKQEQLNFDCITDGSFPIDEDSMPRRWLNLLDLESAIEVYTPLYQLFLTDSDFWRACNSLQLDETVALYTSKLIGDSSYIGLVNNKHPLIPLSTLQAGYRLLLHGLAAECLHATLVQFKRQGRTAPVFAH